MKEKKSFKEKVKKNKKKILVGIGLASLFAMTYGSIKYKEEVKEFVTNIRKKDKLSVATFHKNQVSKGSESNYTENNTQISFKSVFVFLCSVFFGQYRLNYLCNVSGKG